MTFQQLKTFIEDVLAKYPNDWLNLTTHRLDIYNEALAKTEFLECFEHLYNSSSITKNQLAQLPTAYDYIRLGHPLSSILEWALAKIYNLPYENVIAFSSKTMSLLAILRENSISGKTTQVIYQGDLLSHLNPEVLKNIYNYNVKFSSVDDQEAILNFEGTTVYISQNDNLKEIELQPNIDFYISTLDNLGSLVFVNQKNSDFIPAIQHVRRRESIAMTPQNSHKALQILIGQTPEFINDNQKQKDLIKVRSLINSITHTNSKPLLGSCGLSVQYAIMMGLIHEARERYPEKPIKIIVPPNCYGGTNDQARRVAASQKGVDILDLPVDGSHDMVQSTNEVLKKVAKLDAIPLIIAEIPTNPRVEVPNLNNLKEVLSKNRFTPSGNKAIEPIFILDQTFCPDYNFLGEEQLLADVKTISYVSGSKFPSGGKCTAGYLVCNSKASYLTNYIETNLKLCDNTATALQLHYLAEQLPSMKNRIKKAYKNTRQFVDFINEVLPEANINFVSKKVSNQGFTPSVFSLDLPTKGETPEERETYKRKLNLKLINMMITEIPSESKYCVSYGQLKGCYWTIPATSTQGTTKEEDKDYIARVSVSPELNLDKHQSVFKAFVEKEIKT
ncbi:PLP-dependent transferase [Psychroflexus sp. ALD_RP9]|uniref:PLP-dependent transferase n=1 Tax=Psychroflexus sp. ALD_RP9 TaxID=2777186 RepID=UPI001A8ED6F7|nr:PLP-dependent transferase [Psychroflexus sp. ALD_RP9]QSS97328.1 PLP-dependent transferase [Psychroflexus sp. ALD_RP9]